MKKLIFLVLLLAGCVRPAENSDDPGNLETAISSFYGAIEKGDDQARFEVYADSVILLPDHGRWIRGKTELARALGLNDPPTGKKYIFRIKDLQRLETAISGNIAYTINEYAYTWHEEGNPPDWKKTKNVHIWRKQANGRWKMQADIWNSIER